MCLHLNRIKQNKEKLPVCGFDSLLIGTDVTFFNLLLELLVFFFFFFYWVQHLFVGLLFWIPASFGSILFCKWFPCLLKLLFLPVLSHMQTHSLITPAVVHAWFLPNSCRLWVSQFVVMSASLLLVLLFFNFILGLVTIQFSYC